MNIQDLGAIGDLIGAVAVVITLIYLAVQVCLNTKQMAEHTNAVRAAAVHASLIPAFDNRSATFSDENTAGIYYQGLTNPEMLDNVAILRFRLIMANVVDEFWNVYAQTKMTGFSPETWEAQAMAVRRILASNGGRWYWEKYKSGYHQEFREEVDKVIPGDVQELVAEHSFL